MKTEQARADFHVHYYPDKLIRHNEKCPQSLDEETQKTIARLVEHNVVYVGILGRAVAGDPETITMVKNALEDQNIESVFGMEYHSLLPENLRHLTPNGFVDLVCLEFDHSSPIIKEKFGPNATASDIRIVKEYLEKLSGLGFNLKPQTQEQEKTLNLLNQGKITNKADYLAVLISELSEQNEDAITFLEREFGPITDIDKRNNGFTPLKNWLYRLLFQPPTGLASRYLQTQTDVLIKIIHQAGGIVLYSPEEKFNPAVMGFLLEHDIDGVMAWHGAKLEDVPISWIKSLRKDRKLILGGSDYDPVKDDWQPGIGKGTMYISPRRAKELNIKPFLLPPPHSRETPLR